MSVDQLARSATSEVRTTAAARDAAALRHDLDRRLARHRRRTVALAVAVVLAIVLSGLTVVVARRHSSTAPPVAPRPTPSPSPALPANGPIVVSDARRLQAVDPRTGHVARGLALPSSAEVDAQADGFLFSADGSRLLIETSAGPRLWVPATGSLSDAGLCTAWCTPALSPDGRTAVVRGSTDLDLVEIGGTPRHPVVGTQGAGDVVAFSPDGSRLAYVAGRDPSRLVVQRLDGSEWHDLQLSPDLTYAQVAWSPDGTRLLLLGLTGPIAPPHPHTIRLSTVLVLAGRPAAEALLRDVGTCYCLGFGPGVAWSPDGRQIAVVTIGTPKPGGDGLNVMNADGSGLRFVLAGSVGVPGWQPVPR